MERKRLARNQCAYAPRSGETLGDNRLFRNVANEPCLPSRVAPDLRLVINPQVLGASRLFEDIHILMTYRGPGNANDGGALAG